jgi:hypothetical protein
MNPLRLHPWPRVHDTPFFHKTFSSSSQNQIKRLSKNIIYIKINLKKNIGEDARARTRRGGWIPPDFF